MRAEVWATGQRQNLTRVTARSVAPIPEVLEDMHRAVRFIKVHAKEYGVDPEKLGIEVSRKYLGSADLVLAIPSL